MRLTFFITNFGIKINGFFVTDNKVVELDWQDSVDSLKRGDN